MEKFVYSFIFFKIFDYGFEGCFREGKKVYFIFFFFSKVNFICVFKEYREVIDFRVFWCLFWGFNFEGIGGGDFFGKFKDRGY